MSNMVKGRTVFLSGPMSGIDNYNVGAFADAHAILLKMGAHKVFDPAVEYLTDRESQDGNKTHAYWLRKCIHELTEPMGNFWGDQETKSKYSILVSLPGWEDSEGARTERTVAEACGMKVADLADVIELSDVIGEE